MKTLFYKGGDEDIDAPIWVEPYGTAKDDGETVEFESGDIVNVEFDEHGVATLYTEGGHWYHTISLKELKLILFTALMQLNDQYVAMGSDINDVELHLKEEG